MKLQEVEQEALALSEQERAVLALSLMDTLNAPGADVSDEEVVHRDAQMESGAVAPMLHEEFIQRVQKGRWRNNKVALISSAFREG
jgi:hypothetical protein